MASPPLDENTPTPIQPVLFRSSKKRKTGYRQRPETQPEDNNKEAAETTQIQPHFAKDDTVSESTAKEPLVANQETPRVVVGEEEEEPASIAEALRLRALRKSRLNGVGFRAQSSNDAAKGDPAANPERGLIPRGHENDAAIELGTASRFAPQTGLTGELVNRHIIETF